MESQVASMLDARLLRVEARVWHLALAVYAMAGALVVLAAAVGLDLKGVLPWAG